jgi:glucuronate isomerase
LSIQFQEDKIFFSSIQDNIAGFEIGNFDTFKKAMPERIEYFHNTGCRVSDHALDPILYRDGTEEEASAILKKRLSGETLSVEEIEKYKTQVLIFLGKQYAKLSWTMQLHLGTIRNNSTRMMRLLGPDSGFDSIGDWNFANALSKLLDKLDDSDELPRTILYCLNPRDNEVFGTLTGCFH